jgi:peptidoglycan/LPS O-acetylase OafA/YrhL
MLEPQLKRFQSALASRWFLCVPALTFLLPLIQFWNSRVYQTVGLSALHLGIALSLRHMMERRYRLLNSAPVMWLGGISYSLYLWQQPFLDRWSSAPWAAFPLNLVLSVVLAAASYYLVEKPGLELRERFSPRRLPFVVTAPETSAGPVVEELTSVAEPDPATAVGG